MVSEMESNVGKNSTTTTVNQSINNNNNVAATVTATYDAENVANTNNNNNNSNDNNNDADIQEQYSAQTVAIEFVRQYYTMMNRAPQHLFRFVFVITCLITFSHYHQFFMIIDSIAMIQHSFMVRWINRVKIVNYIVMDINRSIIR